MRAVWSERGKGWLRVCRRKGDCVCVGERVIACVSRTHDGLDCMLDNLEHREAVVCMRAIIILRCHGRSWKVMEGHGMELRRESRTCIRAIIILIARDGIHRAGDVDHAAQVDGAALHRVGHRHAHCNVRNLPTGGDVLGWCRCRRRGETRSRFWLRDGAAVGCSRVTRRRAFGGRRTRDGEKRASRSCWKKIECGWASTREGDHGEISQVREGQGGGRSRGDGACEGRDVVGDGT